MTSEFRTMKYRPKYPGTFTDLEQARAFMAWYVPWYNAERKHFGIALFSPNEVHDGTWQQAWGYERGMSAAVCNSFVARGHAIPTNSSGAELERLRSRRLLPGCFEKS